MNTSPFVNDKNNFLKKYFPKIADSLTQKIGASPFFNVSVANVTLFWDLCTAEYSIMKIKNQFCSLFTREDFENIELYHDIGAYFSKGYGWDLSYQIACPLASNVFDVMERKMNGTDYTKAFLRFGHAETILPFIARLGLFKDNFSLHWDADRKLLDSRLWRTSHISTFSSNVAFILYECDEDFKVELLLNEGQITFEKCNNLTFCPYEQFRNMFNFIDEQCHFNTLCGIHEGCTQQNISYEKEMIVLSTIFASSIISIILGIMLYLKCSHTYYKVTTL